MSTSTGASAARTALRRLGVVVGGAVAAAALALALAPAAQAAPAGGPGGVITPCQACSYVKPDLTVSSLQPDLNRAAIKNVGVLDAAGSWAYVRNNFQGRSALVQVPPLRAGQEFAFTFPADISADHCTYVVADYYNQINEVTDGNNVGALHDAYCG